MRYILGLAGVAAAVFAVLLLRDATLSTHQQVEPDSQIELVMHVSTKGAEAGQTRVEMAEALLLTCRLEVHSDPVGPIEDIGNDRFRVVLSPSMDTTDRRQFRGCLDDWGVDHVRVDVEHLVPIE